MLIDHPGVYGVVAERDGRDPQAPELVTAADVLEHDLDGVASEPRGRPLYSERFIHAEIYRRRPDVHAAVLDHSPGARSPIHRMRVSV